MDRIYETDNLEELKLLLDSYDRPSLYRFLVSEFKNLVEYKDANEWNKLVSVCESLSIVGWGPLERVDAICFKSMNIWKTELRNREKELRFLSAGWTKRKKGFIYSNPAYYFSPDIPEKASIDWKDYPKQIVHEVNVPKLLDQRNKQKVNPIVMGGIYTLNSKIERNMLFPLWFDLRKRMDRNLHVDLYGDGVDNIAIRYVTAEPNEKMKTSLLRGTYYPKTRKYNAEAFFGEDYAEASEKERKKIISSLLFQVLEDVRHKIDKYGIDYDISLLQNEVSKEIADWIEQEN